MSGDHLDPAGSQARPLRRRGAVSQGYSVALPGAGKISG